MTAMRKPDGGVGRRALLGAGAMLALPALARAQDARTVRLVVPFGPGGITDLVSRVVAERAAVALGQTIVVENRPGANGNLAGEYVSRAPADGSVVLMASLAMFSVNPAIYARMPYDAMRDFAFVASVASTPHILVSGPKVTAPDLKALTAAAKAQPEALTFGTAGAGSSPHLTQLLFQQITGSKLLEVHFRSGAASVQSVLAGQVDLTAEATPIVMEHVRAGTLRAHVAAAPERIVLLPEVPSAAELGIPSFENGSVSGIVAPRDTPAPVVARLADAFIAALRAPETVQRLQQQGTVPLAGDGAAFRAVVEREIARWRPLLAGVTAS